MVKSYNEYANDGKVNESVISVILGATLAVYGLRFFGEFTKGLVLNAKLPKDILQGIVDEMVSDAVDKKVVNVNTPALLNSELITELKNKIETGDIKSAAAIRQYLKNFIDNQIK